MADPVPKRTEAELLGLLKRRFTEKAGNGDAWAFIPHVRNGPGFDASRTADALVLGLWPSRGMLLQGFEIKCSRQDWVKELGDPSKAEAFARYCDTWSLVVGHDTIVQRGELPDGWGLYIASGRGLTCKVEPKVATETRIDIPRGFLVPLLRAALREGVAAELAQVKAKALDEAKSAVTFRAERDAADLATLRAAVAGFEEESGVKLERWQHGADLIEIGKALRETLAQGKTTGRLAHNLRAHADSVERAVVDLRKAADEIDGGAE